MSFKGFKGWENIDGSAVLSEETDMAFSIVMQEAKAIEREYVSIKLRERAVRLKRIAAAAAAAVLLVMIPAVTYWYMEDGDRTEERTARCHAPNGEISEMTLSDGTRVVLNAGSTLSYPKTFGRKRKVSLSGEAVFYVTASRLRPFIVNTESLDVEAHGTVFNVCDYPEDLSASATLCSGKISVSRSDRKGEDILLKENHQLKYEKKTGATAVVRMDGEDAISWKDGELRIKSMPFEQVLKIIARRFDVSIHLTTDAHNSAVLTAKFINNESIEQLMDAISRLVPGMSYSIEDDDIYIM